MDEIKQPFFIILADTVTGPEPLIRWTYIRESHRVSSHIDVMQTGLPCPAPGLFETLNDFGTGAGGHQSVNRSSNSLHSGLKVCQTIRNLQHRSLMSIPSIQIFKIRIVQVWKDV